MQMFPSDPMDVSTSEQGSSKENFRPVGVMGTVVAKVEMHLSFDWSVATLPRASRAGSFFQVANSESVELNSSDLLSCSLYIYTTMNISNHVWSIILCVT